jgi:hypothetical protein
MIVDLVVIIPKRRTTLKIVTVTFSLVYSLLRT